VELQISISNNCLYRKLSSLVAAVRLRVTNMEPLPAKRMTTSRFKSPCIDATPGTSHLRVQKSRTCGAHWSLFSTSVSTECFHSGSSWGSSLRNFKGQRAWTNVEFPTMRGLQTWGRFRGSVSGARESTGRARESSETRISGQSCNSEIRPSNARLFTLISSLKAN